MRLLSYLLIVLLSSCVDPILIDVGQSNDLPLVIDGFISNLSGPYTVQVSSSFDIKSNINLRSAREVSKLIISDNAGNREQLVSLGNGIYQTVNFQGITGRVYKLEIELPDGKKYESLPDTLLPSPSLDSVWFELNQNGNGFYASESAWGFDVLSNSSSGKSGTNAFMWSAVGIFQVDTQPELINQAKSKCYRQDPENNQCSFIPPCSGLYNKGTSFFPNYVRVKPCTCCTCWYNMYSPRLILSDNGFRHGPSRFLKNPLYRVPVSPLLLMHKMYVELSMRSLTAQSFAFWKVIKNQQQAVGSIFQPITGKIAKSFVQVSGSPSNITGIFFSAGIDKRMVEIRHEDVSPDLYPPIPAETTFKSCFDLYPNATNVKPSFWVD